MTPSRHSFHVYQVPGGKKGWRWRLYGGGGHLVAVSGEGFADEAACRAATHALTEQAAGAKYAPAV